MYMPAYVDMYTYGQFAASFPHMKSLSRPMKNTFDRYHQPCLSTKEVNLAIPFEGDHNKMCTLLAPQSGRFSLT